MAKKTLTRLIRHKNALQRFKKLGFIKVFSDNLADATGSTPSQVRKDFSLFGISGNKRGGYQINELLEQLNSLLGKDKIHNVIVAGAGNIGSALLKYEGFEKEGIKIIAAVDIDPAKHKPSGKIPVLPLDKMKDFIKKHNIQIGIITVPDIAAQQVLDIMVSAGIRGILNFAPIRLKADERIVIKSVNLALELENIIYFVSARDKEKKS